MKLPLLSLALALAVATLPHAAQAQTQAAEGLQLEKVVMVVRHGIRAPLSDEAPVGEMARQPWPQWPVRESWLTPRGFEGMRLLGVYDREAFSARGLFGSTGCPERGTVRIRSSTAQRAIESGKALAQGFAPDCGITVEHGEPGTRDPVFDPRSTGMVRYDGAAAVASIDAHIGGIRQLAERNRAAFRTLEEVLGCRGKGIAKPCDILAEPSVLKPGADPSSFDFGGPIRTASGTAQVFLLEYAEGFPQEKVGWGRADPKTIEAIGALHSLLFDVHVRAPYVASRQSAVLGRRILASLQDPSGAKLDLVVGHDNNLNGMAAVLGVKFKVEGYAENDATVGGALVFELLRDPASATRYVRVVYQSQTLEQLRALAPLSVATPPSYQTLPIAECASGRGGMCTLEDFTRLIGGKLAPLDGSGAKG
jgi:4-phytase / acid phosphatase